MQQHLRRWAAVAVIVAVLVVVVACGGGSLKASGEECFASSECDQGLVCDFGRSPAVCASTGTIVDAAPVVEVDADPVDASPDPGPDAAIDAAIDAPIDAAVDAL
jgi:hypothetical protein